MSFRFCCALIYFIFISNEKIYFFIIYLFIYLFWRMNFTYSRFVSSPDPMDHVSFSHHMVSIVCYYWFHILSFFSRTTGPNCTKLGYKTPLTVSFQNHVLWLPDIQDGCQGFWLVENNLWKSLLDGKKSTLVKIVSLNTKQNGTMASLANYQVFFEDIQTKFFIFTWEN